MEFICERITKCEEVKLEDMIWAEKLARHNRTAATMLRQARRRASNPEMVDGSLDHFMNAMDLGDPDPSNHKTRFESADDIVDWFSQDKPEDWRQRD